MLLVLKWILLIWLVLSMISNIIDTHTVKILNILIVIYMIYEIV